MPRRSSGLPRTLILNGIIAGALLQLITLPLAGWLSDRFGRKPIYLTGAVLSIACAFPVFWLLDTRDPVFVVAGLALMMNVTHAIGIGMVRPGWRRNLAGIAVSDRAWIDRRRRGQRGEGDTRGGARLGKILVVPPDRAVQRRPGASEFWSVQAAFSSGRSLPLAAYAFTSNRADPA